MGMSAQGKFVLQDVKSQKIKFKLINNLIVFPVEINGVELSFLLDTGVSKPIIFNFLNINEALQINQAERIYLRGLGEGEAVEALKSSKNIFRIGNAININQDLYAIFDPALNFAPRLGVPIHGIIGYDFLKDFVVEINYSARYIKLNNPATYKRKFCKKCVEFDLDFFNNKPYIDGTVNLGEEDIPVKLLIDSGGSDAVWLFEDEERAIEIPDKNFEDFLGRGLSGRVYGKRAKIELLKIGKFEMKRVNVAFPDSLSISFARKFKERSGTVAGNVLKRFNIIMDYRNGKISLKRNRNFGSPFYYNKSGMELEHDGVRVVREVDKNVELNPYGTDNESVAQQSMIFTGTYKYILAPSFTIVEIRKDSPAEKSGLMIGDVILNINNRHAHNYSMQQIIQMFYGETGKRIKLIVDRKGAQMKFEFKLVSLL
ncbi:MAG: aspartyl protease family protein [Bacteroidia bacterium]|nr:aspartyl protease family protein [Bacteroidia bacterium]NNK73368.1 PDZ domain-containing protein [Flavobacteriaceae bacterium]